MTKQESFKRRIRERMDKTGERYAAARRALISASPPSTKRVWASQPETSDEAISAGTGRGWDEWCDLIDSWPGRSEGHAAIARFVQSTYEISGWWAQGVTVGYERITGLRLPHQMADGSFTASKSRTMEIETAVLRELLLSEEGRRDLFPDVATKLRSRSTAKSIRISIGPGMALFTLDPANNGQTKLTVTHEKLPTFDAVEEWKPIRSTKSVNSWRNAMPPSNSVPSTIHRYVQRACPARSGVGVNANSEGGKLFRSGQAGGIREGCQVRR
jgi:hypothetical protein